MIIISNTHGILISLRYILLIFDILDFPLKSFYIFVVFCHFLLDFVFEYVYFNVLFNSLI